MTPETLASLRQALATNEASDQDIVLVYFNQGVLTGDWDGPHISPIAAYNQETRQVLIMDVDREWYVSYWATDQWPRAMLCAPTAEHDRFAEGPGDLVWIWPTPAALVSGTHGRQASARPAEDVGGWRRALGERRRS